MKIKKIIYLYLFALSLTLLGSEISDGGMKKAIEESLKDQHADLTVTEQNLAYNLLTLKYELEKRSKTLEEKAYIMFLNLNKKIKEARENGNSLEQAKIQEEIKGIMTIVPHEVLESEKINGLDSFTMMWGGIQREEGERVDDPLESREEKIIEEATISKIKKTESDIKIYNEALETVNQYIKENNLKEDQIINEKEERIKKEKEQADQKMQEIKNKLTRELENKKKEKEDSEALRQVAKFEKEQEEKNRIARENDPTLKEIQKIRDIMYEKASDYFNTKNFETALTEAKKKYNEAAINDIKQKIELIMQYCPHEFFTEEKIQNTFPKIKNTWQNAQRGRRTESKIPNPTENNKEDLEHWKNTLSNLRKYIFFENLPLRFGFTRIKLKAEKTKRNHIQSGLGIGLVTGLAGILLQNNFFKSSNKKIDLLQKALIFSGFTISGGIGGKYFYQMKQYIPQTLRKDKPNKIH